MLQRYPTGQEFVVESIVGINHNGRGRNDFLNMEALSNLFFRCGRLERPNYERHQDVRLQAGNVT